MLTLYFDYPSPASVVALVRLQAIADAGGDVAFVGIDTLGLEIAVPPTLDLLAELERTAARCAEVGLPLRRPSRQPPTLAAHLLGERAELAGVGAAWRHACLEAYWQRDVDLSDELALVRLAADVGVDEGEAVALLGDRRRRVSLRSRMAGLRTRGVGGVPVLEVDGVLCSASLPDTDLRVLAGLRATG